MESSIIQINFNSNDLLNSDKVESGLSDVNVFFFVFFFFLYLLLVVLVIMFVRRRLCQVNSGTMIAGGGRRWKNLVVVAVEQINDDFSLVARGGSGSS